MTKLIFVPPSAKPPLIAPGDVPSGHPKAVDAYWAAGVLASAMGQLHWDLIHLTRFHHAAYRTVADVDARLDAMAARLSPKPEVKSDPDEMEMSAIAHSRARTAIDDGTAENAAVAAFADELFIVGLWALAEQYLGKALNVLPSANGSYRWDDINNAFLQDGIDLATLPGYNGANECRLVNNAIKHTGVVNDRLSQFPAFHGLKDKPIRRLSLDAQRYLNCVHHLLGSAMESAECVVQGVPNHRPFRTDLDGNPLPPQT